MLNGYRLIYDVRFIVWRVWLPHIGFTFGSFCAVTYFYLPFFRHICISFNVFLYGIRSVCVCVLMLHPYSIPHIIHLWHVGIHIVFVLSTKRYSKRERRNEKSETVHFYWTDTLYESKSHDSIINVCIFLLSEKNP